MTIKDVFNFLILALSLSTVFLTLLSFFIFKIRQVQTMRSRNSEFVLETAFFRRYAPQLAAHNRRQAGVLTAEEEKTLPWIVKTWRHLQERYPSLFGANAVIFASCTVALFVAFVASHLAKQGEFQSEISGGVERVQELQKKGLLQRRQFDPFAPNPKLEETIPSAQEKNLQAQVGLLKGLRIVVMKVDSSDSVLGESSEQAEENWVSFLAALGVRDVETREPSTLSLGAKSLASTLVIVPQVGAWSEQSRREVEHLLDKGVHLLIVGTPGEEGSRGDFGAWLEKWFGDSASLAPLKSMIEGDWPSDPGRETASEKEWIRLGETAGSRRLWMGFELSSFEKRSRAQQFYLRTVLVRALLWTGHRPLVAMDLWKGGQSGVVSVVTSGYEEDSLTDLVDQAREDRLPITVFMTPGKRSRWHWTPDWMTSSELRPELRVPDEVRGWGDLVAGFDQLQNMRFTLERRSEKPVRGLHLDRAILTPQELKLAQQMGLDFMIAPFPSQGARPVFVGDLIVLPTMPIDDVSISERVEVTSVNGVMDTMLRDVDQAVARSGYALVTLRSQQSGSRPYRKALIRLGEGLRKRDLWMASPVELAQWWRARQSATLRYEKGSDGAYDLVVGNQGMKPLMDLSLRLRLKPDLARDLASAGERPVYTVRPLDSGWSSITIHHLEPGTSVKLSLENER